MSVKVTYDVQGVSKKKKKKKSTPKIKYRHIHTPQCVLHIPLI